MLAKAPVVTIGALKLVDLLCTLTLFVFPCTVTLSVVSGVGVLSLENLNSPKMLAPLLPQHRQTLAFRRKFGSYL